MNNSYIDTLSEEALTGYIETRKDVGAECRHDMRPSAQLPSVPRSGANSKADLTMVRPKFAVGACL